VPQAGGTVRQALAGTVEQEGERQDMPPQLNQRNRTCLVAMGEAERCCGHTESRPAVGASGAA